MFDPDRPWWAVVARLLKWEKELDPLVLKGRDETDDWMARSPCPEMFRRRREFK